MMGSLKDNAAEAVRRAKKVLAEDMQKDIFDAYIERRGYLGGKMQFISDFNEELNMQDNQKLSIINRLDSLEPYQREVACRIARAALNKNETLKCNPQSSVSAAFEVELSNVIDDIVLYSLSKQTP